MFYLSDQSHVRITHKYKVEAIHPPCTARWNPRRRSPIDRVQVERPCFPQRGFPVCAGEGEGDAAPSPPPSWRCGRQSELRRPRTRNRLPRSLCCARCGEARRSGSPLPATSAPAEPVLATGLASRLRTWQVQRSSTSTGRCWRGVGRGVLGGDARQRVHAPVDPGREAALRRVQPDRRDAAVDGARPPGGHVRQGPAP